MVKRFLKEALCLSILSLLFVQAQNQSVYARNQWDINHGASNPPVDPRFNAGGNMSGQVPAFHPSFWQGNHPSLGNQIQTGTVLTAILEDDLHSGKNVSGDSFALTIEDGFATNGNMLIPPKTKIIGTVTSTSPAKYTKQGIPGQMDVSLQSLVFPDGVTVPFHGFIDGNPNHLPKKSPKHRNHGQDLRDFGQSVSSMLGSFTSGFNFVHARRHRGIDFILEKGEAIPVRLTRSLQIPQSEIKPITAQTAPGTGAATVPGLVPAQPVPGLAGISGTGSGPNEFSQPIQPTALPSMPDPF